MLRSMSFIQVLGAEAVTPAHNAYMTQQGAR